MHAGGPLLASLTQCACCGAVHVTSQRLPLLSAVHDVVAVLELIELDVPPVLVEAETLEELREVIPPVDASESSELVTLLEVVDSMDVVTPAA